MAKTIETWLKEDVSKIKRKGIGKISSEYFFRDPIRPNIIDNEKFYTPADGTIMYQKIVKDCNDPILEIKGINYTLKEVMGDPKFDKPCLVIGIFLSFYDVHIIRVPYSGVLKYKQLESIESYNMPMLAVEKNLLRKVINPDNMEYLKNNERMISTIYSPTLDYTYYVTMIADEDVDVIMPFSLDQNEPFNQNERSHFVRWGSQAELIMVLDDRYDFELLQENHMHVECCYDALVRIHRKSEEKY